jgi:hypothetical protein
MPTDHTQVPTESEHWLHLVDMRIAVALTLVCAALVELVALSWAAVEKQSLQPLCRIQPASADLPSPASANQACAQVLRQTSHS